MKITLRTKESLIAELKDKDTEMKRVKNLLNECIEHLEFCNYGDSWENECAEPLIKKVEVYQEESGV